MWYALGTMMQEKGSFWALLPIGVFVLLFAGSGLVFGDFYLIPPTLVFLIALFVALGQGRGQSFNRKLEICAAGAGESNLVMMCLIYLLAGAFSGVAGAAGGVSATVNFTLSFIPASLAIPGLFAMGCFISMAMGTSVGTIIALTPIAVELCQKTGFALPMAVGAVVCGALFGDNLSFISDTTIAAVRTQGCEMRDKFKANFLIVLPAALATLGLFVALTWRGVGAQPEALSYNLWLVLPYVAVLVGALCGLNVFLVLAGGIVLSGAVGLGVGTLTVRSLLAAIGSGMGGMYELALLAILAACISALVRHHGGFAWLLALIHRRLAGYRGAQMGIVLLVSLLDIATANNTIAIVLAGPMAKQIATQYGISPKRSASLLDIFGSVFQGLLPYGAQLLSAARLSGIAALAILPYLFYIYLMALCALVAVACFPRRARAVRA